MDNRMKLLKKWFANMCREAWENAQKIEQDVPARLATVSERSLATYGINFSVYRADGGFVVETRQYDRKRDENNISLHVITDDRDLGQEIGKIITYQNLRS